MRSFAALLALAGCGGDPAVFADPRTIELTFPSVPNRKLDLLFVAYNSPGGAESSSLGSGAVAVIDAVASVTGVLPDLHIAVTTTDLGTTGSIDPSLPGPTFGICAGAGDDGRVSTHGAIADAFFVDEDDGNGGRRTNYTGELAAALDLAIRGIGQGGCPFEQPLHATRRALANPANAGFLREDAHLAIVIVSAEDDCSVLDAGFFTPDTTALGPLASYRCTREGVVCDEPIDEAGTKTHCRPRNDSSFIEPIELTVEALRAVKRNPAMLSVGAIVAPASPFLVALLRPQGSHVEQLVLGNACVFTTPTGAVVASPAVRIAALAGSFGGRGAVASICSVDYKPSLREVGRLLKHPLGVVCLDSSRLTDSSTERGIQPACELTEISGDTETRLADFTIAPDPVACPETADHLRLVVNRTDVPAAGAYIRARCETPFEESLPERTVPSRGSGTPLFYKE